MAPGAMMGAAAPAAELPKRSRTSLEDGTAMNAPQQPHSEAFEKMMRAQMRAHNKQMYADVGRAGSDQGRSQQAHRSDHRPADRRTSDFARSHRHPAERRALIEEAIAREQGGDRRPHRPREAQVARGIPAVDSRRGRSWTCLRASSKARTPRPQRRSTQALLAALIEERKRFHAAILAEGTDQDDFAKA